MTESSHNAPVIHNGIYIWPIDPELYQVRLDVSPPQVAINQAKFDLVLVDCAIYPSHQRQTRIW